MESKGCTPELLNYLINIEKKTNKEIMNLFGINDWAILNRWMIEGKVTRNLPFDVHYFDQIDSANKAYWMGFFWCDGYVTIRERFDKRINLKYYSHDFQLALAKIDEDHIRKFQKEVNSNHKLGYQKHKSPSTGNICEGVRVRLDNKSFVKNLVDKYGLIPHRTDATKVINMIPSRYVRDFIRGVLDADGTISYYPDKYKGFNKTKYKIRFTTYFELVEFIDNHFFDIGLTTKTRTISHKSGDCYASEYNGRRQCVKILSYLYDKAEIYLDRKYIKYREFCYDNTKDIVVNES